MNKDSDQYAPRKDFLEFINNINPEPTTHELKYSFHNFSESYVPKTTTTFTEHMIRSMIRHDL